MIEKIDIAASKVELTEDLNKYITKKFGRLDKYMSRHARKSVHAEVKLKEETGKKKDKYTVEAIIHMPNKTLTAIDSTINVFAAIDIVEAKLKNQLRKIHEKTANHKSDRKGFLKRARARVDREFRARQN